MNEPKIAPAIGGLAEPKVYVKVQRGGRPPMPWTWEIQHQGEAKAHESALRGYRSAEEAWEAGRAALARLGRAGPR
jgi:hypothetical protein